MKSLLSLLVLVTTARSQEMLEVNCGHDAIVARLNEQTAVTAQHDLTDLHFNDPNCFFDGIQNGYYVKRLVPLTTCGTEVETNDTHAVFTNSISSTTVRTGLSYPHGIIVGQPDNLNVIAVSFSCTYKIDLRLSAAFIPNITYFPIPIPDTIGDGFFQVAMAIYKDSSYLEFYESTPTLQPDDTVFVGITMVQDTSSDVFIRMERCWATPSEIPTSNPYYDLILDRCPVDGAVDGSVAVTQNGVGHQALWQTQVFRFVGEGDEFRTVWLHCDLTICVGEPCQPDCGARRRRRSTLGDDSESRVVSYGPIVQRKKADVFYTNDGLAVVVFKNETLQASVPENVKVNDAMKENREDQASDPSPIPERTLLIAIGAFASFCVLCLTLALVVVLMRMKRRDRNAGPPVESTGTINKGFSI